jgi:hypothetical protein
MLPSNHSFRTDWWRRVCWSTITYDFMAHENDTRTTSCRQGSHAGALVGYHISLCLASVNQVQYVSSLSYLPASDAI